MSLNSNSTQLDFPSRSSLRNKLKFLNPPEIKHFDNWFPFYNFGNLNDNDSKHSEPVIHINNHNQESCRKKLLSLIKELKFRKCKISSSISLAHLFTDIGQRIVFGLIKMSGLSLKEFQNTGPVEIRFVVLIGEVNIQIENTSVYKNNGVNTVIRIPSYTSYTLQNVINDDTYLFFKCQSYL